jgi:transcriptional regulator with XRE-family HTH domain
VNIEGREKLIEVIKLARGSMSQRAFGKLLGVSATAVQLWEKGVNVPDTENLAKIAARSGYKLEEILGYLEGKLIPEASDLNLILKQIKYMPLNEVAMIAQAAAERFAVFAQSSGDEAAAS